MFDSRTAKMLQAGSHLTVPEAPGLRLVASQTRRTWTYRFKSPEDGRMRQVKLGEWPAMSVAAAITAWQALRTQRAAGVDLAREKRRQRAAAGPVTVRDLCDDYLGGYDTEVSPKRYAEVERMLRVDLSAIEALPAAEVTRAQAYGLIHDMRDRPVQARQLRQILGAVWDRAHDAGRLPEDAPNWWRLVLRGKLASRGKRLQGDHVGAGKRVLTEAEVGVLLRWLPNMSRDMADILTLYLWTCCRGSEIVAMRRDEVTQEADGWWWMVPRERLKMARSEATADLRVPLVGRALAIVQRRLEAHGAPYLFTSRARSGHIEQKAVGVAVWHHMPYCTSRPDEPRARLPVTHWAPHDLRRTGRTVLAALGCPTEIGEAILGHAQPGVQGVYNRHRYDAERREWLTRLSDRWESL